MTPAQAKAVLDAAPMDRLRAVTVHDVTGLDGNRARMTAELAGVGLFTVDVYLPFGPLPLSASELLAIVVSAQSALAAAATKFETDFGRGFDQADRGAINTSQGYRAGGGWV